MLNACKNLRYLVVPNSVKRMEQDALESCRALTQVEIGSSVEEICEDCFLYCEKLSALFVHATTPPVLDEKAFEGKAYNYVLVNVPIGCAEKYKQAPVWKNFKYIQEGATDRYDVNEDGYINAADVVSIYNRIINGD